MKAPDTAIDRDLIDAASAGEVSAARQALLQGANPNAAGGLDALQNVTAIMFAVRNNHAAVVKLLLHHGAELEKRVKCILPGEPSRETALHWAIRQQNRNICKLLIEAGADVEAESSLGSPLIYAIQGSEKTDKN